MKLKKTEIANEDKIKVDDINIRKINMLLFMAFFFIAITFYFLAGEQLRLRESRDNLLMPVANSETLELVNGASVEQKFIVKIQRLKKISITWGDYHRTNTGAIQVELYELQNHTLLMSQSLSAAEITEGFVSTMIFDEPLEQVYNIPLLIRISSDSSHGSAVTPLMDTKSTKAGFQLNLNGAPSPGILCFSVQGEDYIWTGLHYWEFVAVGAFLLSVSVAVLYYKYKHQKKSLFINTVVAVKKYRYLIEQLVARDFKTKYKRSVLGVLWSFLNPLLMMVIQYFVFSAIFKSDIPNYPVYLLSGIVMFNFFSEACGMTLNSILGNAALITKVYIPKYIYPLSRILSSGINLAISLVPLFIVILITGLPITKAYVLVVFPFTCLLVFCFGFGMLLASSMVFFRDTQFIWNVLNMVWMYATPIFYPESILADPFLVILKVNPLYYFITFVRICLLNGISPEPILYIQCALFSLGMLLVGAFIFKRFQDRFILYL